MIFLTHNEGDNCILVFIFNTDQKLKQTSDNNDIESSLKENMTLYAYQQKQVTLSGKERGCWAQNVGGERYSTNNATF